MTNEEIIRETRKLSDKHKYDSVLTFGINYHMAFTDVANHIEEQAKENDKLKAENDRLSSDNAWLVLNKSEKEFENVDLLEENNKLKSEIEQLKSEFETYYKLYLASIDARQILTECVEQLKEELEHYKSEVIKKQLL